MDGRGLNAHFNCRNDELRGLNSEGWYHNGMETRRLPTALAIRNDRWVEIDRLGNEETNQGEALQPTFDHAGAGQGICV
jgi:hypothetical protein